ncbi:uncharacterized protein LOC6564420 [Drosophila grimshawi]|uniref:uncharacterized protein LOC6564420 n=1 Tax=Drosophila grimshawi TaxID=7222 RepID=UPI000C86E66E|nr:uncharacterized protein LOC6564420 [Drosophila grimshawi]
MPCFKQEKSIDFRSRRDKSNTRDLMAPKAVRPRAIKHHGLFGMAIASQHLIVDEKWTPASLTEQFTKFTELLTCRVIYKRHETKAHRRRLCAESQRYKSLCADGRIKLQKISQGNNTHKIRNFLIRHKDMQRLYQKMPIHQVVDNINQRTFTMRKERDRLQCRLEQVKAEYKKLLLDYSDVECRIKYENEFVLDEQLKSRVLLKKIENSNVRLKAIKTINNTYKKMLQVLMQDEIFYEPILRSLDGDMEDQSNFIKHILYLGMPAISKFRKLNSEFRQMDERSRENLRAKLAILASLKKPVAIGPPPEVQIKQIATADPKRYVRETESMLILKTELRSIEKTIQRLRLKTLCSQAKEIYPRIKNQVENNEHLHYQIEKDRQNRTMLINKMKYASVMKGVLLNNLSEEEINRLERIRHLKKVLSADEEFERDTMDHIKNRGDAYVMMRLSLWNLSDILRHVDRNPIVFRHQYQTSYLKLPLLKFEMLRFRSAAPKFYEENIDKIMHLLKRKVYKLMKGYKAHMQNDIKSSIEKYHQDYLNMLALDGDFKKSTAESEEVIFQEKVNANIPDRKQIKAQSAKLIDECLKYLDEH